MNRDDITITLVASTATDVLIDESGVEFGRQEGGPARYLARALDRENIVFSVVSPPEVTVEIKITKQGEFGRVRERPRALVLNFGGMKSDLVIISTLLDEINLKTLPDYPGTVFMDIQGYVRDGSDFGKKKPWLPSLSVAESIDCLKATAEEVRYLPDWFIKAMKEKILIITKGMAGCEIYNKRIYYAFSPKIIIQSSNTIGAGDTFLAYFVAEYARSKNIERAGWYATNQTVKFLQTGPRPTPIA